MLFRNIGELIFFVVTHEIIEERMPDLTIAELGFMTGWLLLNLFLLQIDYKLPLEEIRTKTLQVSVWDHDMLNQNNCLGAVYIKLRELDLSKENVQWYKLEKIQITDTSMIA